MDILGIWCCSCQLAIDHQVHSWNTNNSLPEQRQMHIVPCIMIDNYQEIDKLSGLETKFQVNAIHRIREEYSPVGFWEPEF